MLVKSAEFPAVGISVRDARAFVESVGDVPEAIAGDVALLVSEMAANCVLHARSPFRVSVDRRPDRLRIAMTDSSVAPPVVKPYSSDAPTGRGLRLIEALAARWGVDLIEGGKTVWVEFDMAEEEATLRAH